MLFFSVLYDQLYDVIVFLSASFSVLDDFRVYRGVRFAFCIMVLGRFRIALALATCYSECCINSFTCTYPQLFHYIIHIEIGNVGENSLIVGYLLPISFTSFNFFISSVDIWPGLAYTLTSLYKSLYTVLCSYSLWHVYAATISELPILESHTLLYTASPYHIFYERYILNKNPSGNILHTQISKTAQALGKA